MTLRVARFCAMAWKTAVLSDVHASCLHTPPLLTHPHGLIPSKRFGTSAINPILNLWPKYHLIAYQDRIFVLSGVHMK